MRNRVPINIARHVGVGSACVNIPPSPKTNVLIIILTYILTQCKTLSGCFECALRIETIHTHTHTHTHIHTRTVILYRCAVECVRVCSADTYDVCHVAINMPATQISVYVDYGDISHPASNAVDGSRNADLWNGNSCVHSLSHTNPWWTVDLGIPLTITGIYFTNRDLKGA